MRRFIIITLKLAIALLIIYSFWCAFDEEYNYCDNDAVVETIGWDE